MNAIKSLAFAMTLLAAAAALAQNQPAAVIVHAARPSPALAAAEYLAATRAGGRIVAVGEHGTVALSDDGGQHWQQARTVPTSATLTDVSFVDASNGWAVGHWGTILKTVDGGQNWTVQRSDTKLDQPLFSVHFLDAWHGFAVGLWSLMLETRDGGASWQAVTLPKPAGAKRADRNLFKIFATPDHTLLITAERGLVYRSQDRGASWDAVASGYAGSLWTGVATTDGVLLVGGLRGSLYRSTDKGLSWARVEAGTRSSITSLIQLGNRDIVGTALDGVVLRSSDGGQTFRAKQDGERNPYLAVVGLDDGRSVIFGAHGPLSAR